MRQNGCVEEATTELERNLLELVCDLVAQHCYQEDGVYETGCLRTNKDAMKVLVKHGLMVEVRDGFGRNYWARFAR
jgi:hypothetical protein